MPLQALPAINIVTNRSRYVLHSMHTQDTPGMQVMWCTTEHLCCDKQPVCCACWQQNSSASLSSAAVQPLLQMLCSDFQLCNPLRSLRAADADIRRSRPLSVTVIASLSNSAMACISCWSLTGLGCLLHHQTAAVVCHAAFLHLHLILLHVALSQGLTQ